MLSSSPQSVVLWTSTVLIIRLLTGIDVRASLVGFNRWPQSMVSSMVSIDGQTKACLDRGVGRRQVVGPRQEVGHPQGVEQPQN